MIKNYLTTLSEYSYKLNISKLGLISATIKTTLVVINGGLESIFYHSEKSNLTDILNGLEDLPKIIPYGLMFATIYAGTSIWEKFLTQSYTHLKKQEKKISNNISTIMKGLNAEINDEDLIKFEYGS